MICRIGSGLHLRRTADGCRTYRSGGLIEELRVDGRRNGRRLAAVGLGEGGLAQDLGDVGEREVRHALEATAVKAVLVPCTGIQSPSPLSMLVDSGSLSDSSSICM